MTPLERAKAFIQSRAAKTALQILPLALAAVVGTQPAHAATINSASAGFSTSNSGCSGGTCVTFGDASTANTTDQVYTAPGTTSISGSTVTGSGSTSMLVFGGKNGGTTTSFTMLGDASGAFTSVDVSWNFLLTCDATCTGNIATPPTDPTQFQDDFTYDAYALVNGIVYTWSGNGADISSSVDPTAVEANFNIPGPGIVSGTFGAEIDINWLGNKGEQANWSVNSLEIAFNNPTTGVPEPASLMLAFAGLPFVISTIRKRR